MLDRYTEMATEHFVHEIKETDIYRTYVARLGRIKKDAQLFEQVNEYRRRNFEIQNSPQDGDLMDRIDDLERQFEYLRENPMVDDFLNAELALCRMMQEVNNLITEELEFE